MRKLDQRAVLLGLGAIAALALFVGMVLKSDPDGDDKGEMTTSLESNDGTPRNGAAKPAAPATSATPQPAPPTIVVRDGEPVGGIAELSYDHGERARFRVASDRAEEIHLHGYDIAKDVEAGGRVTFDFTADLEGVFEVELERQATQIAELTVNP